jgi:hypothetical protein
MRTKVPSDSPRGSRRCLVIRSGVGILKRAEGASFGVALNNKGEVALTVSIDGGADTLVLLTPAGP